MGDIDTSTTFGCVLHASAWRRVARMLLVLALGAPVFFAAVPTASAAPGEPTLTPGPQTDAAVWDSAVAGLVPLGLAVTEGFETPAFALGDSLVGVTNFDGFTMTVSSDRGVAVDGLANGTNPRTGDQQAAFRWSRSPVIIDIVPDSDALGLGFYVGDLFDGTEGSRVRILADGVLIGDYAGYVGGNMTGPITNSVDGSSSQFGNEIFGLIGGWDPSGPVASYRVIVDTGQGDNFVLDDISVILANPQIGLTKDITAVTANTDGTASIEYTIVATNTGGVELNDVVVDDDVTTVFGSAFQSATRSSDTCTGKVLAEQLLDGSVPVADTQCTIVLDVVIDGAPGVFDNVATVEAIDNFDNVVVDTSTDGVDADPDGDNDPSNNSVPTSIEFVNGSLVLAKTVSDVTNNNDGTFDLVYELEVSAPPSSAVCANDGSDSCYILPSNNVQVVDDLAAVFGADALVSVSTDITAGSCTASSAYTGSAPTTTLLSGADDLNAGESCVVEVSVTLSSTAGEADDAAPGDYTNVAGATSDAVTDPVVSQAVATIPAFAISGAVVDTDGNPIVGVELELFDSQGNSLGTALTGPDGSYTFTGLESGDYTIEETQPDNYISVSDADGGTDNSIAVSVAGAVVPGQDFVEEELVEPEPEPEPEAENDQDLENPAGTTVAIDPLVNDSGDFDPTTVVLSDPATGNLVTTVVVVGEGTWTVDPITGSITFTPEADFLGDPTIVDYQVDTVGGTSVRASVEITYVDAVVTPGLAVSGTETWPVASLAFLLIGLGVGLTWWSRREVLA